MEFLEESSVRYKKNTCFFLSAGKDWTEENEDKEDINVWEDNWDDDNLDDDFSIQLRTELEKQGKNADGSEPMKT